MKKEIDVIICTNKNLLVLKRIINQVFDQKGNFKIKIIIIHQSYSTTLSPNFLKNKNIVYENVKLQNLSAAKNFGLKISKSKLVCFLDDDVSIEKNYILESLKIIKRKKCDLLFSKINQSNSSIPLSKNMGNVDLNINFFNTSCCLSSSMWINLKNSKKFFFDENLGLGAKYGSGEETDYIFKFLKMKKKIYYSSKVLIYHPREFSEFKNLNEISKKFISYGMGQGAILRKIYNHQKMMSYYLFSISLIKSFVAIVINIIKFKKENILKYRSLLKGKILGFIKYRGN